MSHKGAPPETPVQAAVFAFYAPRLAARGETVGWGRDKHGAFLSAYARDAQAAWEAAISSRLAQPAQAVDVGYDDALNDAGWAFIEAMPVQLPGPIFNNVKTALKAAIEKWLATRALTGEKAGTVDGEVLVAIERGEEYEDVAPELVAEDCMGNAAERGWRWRVVSASPAPDKEGKV